MFAALWSEKEEIPDAALYVAVYEGARSLIALLLRLGHRPSPPSRASTVLAVVVVVYASYDGAVDERSCPCVLLAAGVRHGAQLCEGLEVGPGSGVARDVLGQSVRPLLGELLLSAGELMCGIGVEVGGAGPSCEGPGVVVMSVEGQDLLVLTAPTEELGEPGADGDGSPGDHGSDDGSSCAGRYRGKFGILHVPVSPWAARSNRYR